jgi:hypothetical protein
MRRYPVIRRMSARWWAGVQRRARRKLVAGLVKAGMVRRA